jgi:hypothetical protein
VGEKVPHFDAGTVEITGERASVAFVIGGEETPVKLGLWRENGAWRVDLVSLFRLSNTAMREQQQESGKSEDDYVLMLVRQVSRKPVRATIWNPPGDRPPKRP